MHTKSLIIIENRSQIKKLLSLVGIGERQEAELTVIALNGDIAQELTRENLEFRTPEDYGLSEEYLQEEGLRWFRSFPNIRVKDDKNIKEIFVYDGLSLWWLIEQQIYLSQFAFPKVMRTITQAIMLDRIIEIEEPTTVYCADNDTSVSRVVRLICKSRNIATTSASSLSLIKTLLIQKLRATVYIYGLWLRMLLRKMYWIILNRKYMPAVPLEKKRLLIFSSLAWANVRDLKSGEMRKGDPHLDSVIELLKDEREVVSVDVPTEDWGLRIMKEKTQQQRMTYRPFESYLDIGIMLRAIKASGILHRDYKLLSACEGFRQSLYFHNLPLYDLVKQSLSLFFSRSYLTMIIAIIEMAKRMVEVENPDAIIHYADLPDTGRAVIASARLKGIPTLLLQHGLYDRYYPYFNHIESDIGHNGEVSAPYCPIPDKLAISNGYTKDILVRYGKISDADVIITGQPRYDVMAEADRILNRERTFNSLNLDPEKKLIAWMTATHAFTLQGNERHINSVYNAMKSLNDAQLIIKLHPGENQKAPLYRKNRTLRPTILDRYGPTTFELLNASDVVITNGYCSTAIEAIMLDKPVVMIDFGGSLIPPYVECGAALGIYEEDALISVLKDLLHNEETRRRLARGREKFASKGNYKPDGQASQRVADIIRQMSRK